MAGGRVGTRRDARVNRVAGAGNALAAAADA
jgi:hypothetical protein